MSELAVSEINGLLEILEHEDTLGDDDMDSVTVTRLVADADDNNRNDAETE